MENFINNPGLQHIAENVFLNLNHENLEKCRLVNEYWKNILDNPMFWIKKFIRRGGLSKKNQIDWMAAIQITSNSDLEANILRYLKQSSKNERVVDIPCYINKVSLRKYSKRIKIMKDKSNDFLWQHIRQIFFDGNVTLLQIMVMLISNFEDINQRIHDAIICLIQLKNVEMIKILAPLADNPNAPNEPGMTPIHFAASWLSGQSDIVQILAPLTENPNAPNKVGTTPIHYASYLSGNSDIVQILAPLTENPNAPMNDGETPIEMAKIRGLSEIVRILESYEKPAKRAGARIIK